MRICFDFYLDKDNQSIVLKKHADTAASQQEEGK